MADSGRRAGILECGQRRESYRNRAEMSYDRREILKLAPRAPLSGLPHGVGSRGGEGYWLHVSRPAMACRFEVTLAEGPESVVREASLALDEVGRIEAWLSPFRVESELSRVNREAGESAVRVEAGLFGLLERSRTLARETAGAFDITAGPLSRVWGFTRREGRVPTAAELEEARCRVGSEWLALDTAGRTVCFGRPGMEINPGAVGKGYALDRVGRRLREAGLAALLTAGFSSMLALGQEWTVGIGHPRRPGRRLGIVRFRDLALGTSGSEVQSFEHGGVRYGHIIDPRSGWPAPAGAGVTVINPSAERADALATAFYVGGRELAERYCAANPGTLVVMLEAGSAQPLVIGGNPRCEVTILDE